MLESYISQVQAPSNNTCQQKRKRSNSIVAAEPIRKSRRLQEQALLGGIKAEHSNAKQPKLLPSPSTSRTPPNASRDSRKRKAALLLEDDPDQLQVSCEPQQKRLQTGSSVVSGISYGVESRKQFSESEPVAASPSLDPREQLELPRDGRSKKPTVQSKEAVPRTSAPVIESPEEPEKELEAQEIERQDIERQERSDPISYWAAHHTWPKNFAKHNLMASSNNANKRPRPSDSSQRGKDVRSSSYTQSRKNGEVPEPYTAAYQAHILTKRLDMDCKKGEDFASEESKNTCAKLLKIDISTPCIIGPTAVPQDKIRDMIYSCQNRNEAIVNRDVTPLVIPSLRVLYYCGANNLEHVVDEVNADWYEQCVLEGPRLRPDLAIGLFSSAFTEEEIEKLKRYTSVDNWTQVTTQMFFPFLMCEVKCGREGLDMADRQNMHSCSVAVRAILRIEQEADKYRSGKKMDGLNKQVLVFSISHDQSDARLYGHYAIVQGEKWSYYRYRIRKFDLTDYHSLFAIYNFVQNILKSYLPEHVRRLKDAIAAFPDPNKLPESSGLPSSSGLSFGASETSLNDDDNSQQDSQNRDADGFIVPPHPTGSQNNRAKKKGQESWLVEQNKQLMQMLEEQRKKAEQERQQLVRMLEEQSSSLPSSSGLSFKGQENELARLRQLLEEQGEEAKQRESRLVQMLEEQRKKAEQERKEAKEERDKLMQMLEEQRKKAEQEREKAEQEREQERKEAKEERDKLMQILRSN